MKPSQIRFMNTYFQSRESKVFTQQPHKTCSFSDSFDISHKQVPFKKFKEHNLESEYSAKKQKDTLYRILSAEQIKEDDSVRERINEHNISNGYNKQII